METKTNMIEPLISRVEDLGKTSIRLVKLQVIQKSSEIISTSATYGVFLWAFGLSFMLLNIGFALCIGEFLHKLYLGFVCLAGFYSVISLLIYLIFRGSIQRCVANLVIKNLNNSK